LFDLREVGGSHGYNLADCSILECNARSDCW